MSVENFKTMVSRKRNWRDSSPKHSAAAWRTCGVESATTQHKGANRRGVLEAEFVVARINDAVEVAQEREGAGRQALRPELVLAAEVALAGNALAPIVHGWMYQIHDCTNRAVHRVQRKERQRAVRVVIDI
jgi:hypothetical protein